MDTLRNALDELEVVQGALMDNLERGKQIDVPSALSHMVGSNLALCRAVAEQQEFNARVQASFKKLPGVIEVPRAGN